VAADAALLTPNVAIAASAKLEIFTEKFPVIKLPLLSTLRLSFPEHL
jgi:hypothetical protein